MDPFISINYNGCNYKTKPCPEGGMNPIWNMSMEIPIVSFHEASLKVRCYDEDLLSDDFVGEATFKVSQLVREFGVPKLSKVLLKFKGKLAAEIALESTFDPSASYKRKINKSQASNFTSHSTLNEHKETTAGCLTQATSSPDSAKNGNGGAFTANLNKIQDGSFDKPFKSED